MSGWSRRRVLSGGVAASTTLAGCPASKPRPILRFVGPDPTRGHALRDGELPPMPTNPPLRADVLIVGAGVAGAAAAWRLARAGVERVHLLELEPRVGGTAAAGAHPRSPYPMGAHYLPSPHPGFAALHTLLDDLGLAIGRRHDGTPEYDPTLVCRAPLERHRDRGHWHEGLYPADGQTADEADQWKRWQAHLRTLDDVRGADGRRLFDLPVEESSAELRHLDQISIATYLDQLGLTSRRLRWTVDYACRDDYGCTPAETSAFAALHHYLARGLEETHDRLLLVRPEGNAHLVDRMLARADLDRRLHLHTAAIRVEPETGRVQAFDFGRKATYALEAKAILWAAPRFVLSRVLPSGVDPLPPGSLSYAPWLVANLELDRAPSGVGAPLAWDNVAVGEPHLGYVVANHQESLARAHLPGAVLTYYEPLLGDPTEARQRLLDGTLASWGAHVLAAMERMHPGIGAHVRRIDVTRWGHAMIRPTPGWLFGPTRAKAATPIGRVLPCAADVSGLPLFEQAFCSGVAAAEWALARLGKASEPEGMPHGA